MIERASGGGQSVKSGWGVKCDGSVVYLLKDLIQLLFCSLFLFARLGRQIRFGRILGISVKEGLSL